MNKLYLNKKKFELLNVPAHTPINYFLVVKIDNQIITPSDQIKNLGILLIIILTLNHILLIFQKIKLPIYEYT